MRPLMRSISLLLLLLFMACGVKQTAEELWISYEQQLRARQYHRAIKTLETLVAAYPEHFLAPKAQFQIGNIYMNNTEFQIRDFRMGITDDLPSSNDLRSSIAAFQETTARYPETDEGVKALFMIGFMYANHFGNYEAARQAYLDFLNRYPNHELIPSVKFELENLGKPVEEIDALKGVANAS